MSNPHFYELILLGEQGKVHAAIVQTLGKRIAELGMQSNVVKTIEEADVTSRDRKLPALALFVGYASAEESHHPSLVDLIEDSLTIITVVSSLALVSCELPSSLRHINALESSKSGSVDRIVSLILEHFRLLRAERKLFISYKRDDSTPVANALYDELDRRGFDVFLDTRSVPPAKDFQSELWHRLADADVIILLDTPGFRSSRWTVEELARANATNV